MPGEEQVSGHEIVVIGASAGGVEALRKIAAALPADLPAASVVVLHLPPGDTSVLPALLEQAGDLRAAQAVDGEPIEPGRIYLSPPGQRLLVDGGVVRLRPNGASARDGDGRVGRAEREFVTNAAHELRTPLAAISSAVEVLQAGAKEVPEERDRFLAHIDRQCRRLARLTTSLLSLARAQGGVEAPRLELVELCPLLEQLAQEATPAEGVTVEAGCPRDLVALANPDLLEQALANLVSNAARHTREGSIVLSASPHDGKVAIEVRDTGRGMSAEERARVTERFYRGSDGDGFGLGLAIAAEAVRVLGAELELESEVGGGTTARVILPSARLVPA